MNINITESVLRESARMLIEEFLINEQGWSSSAAKIAVTGPQAEFAVEAVVRKKLDADVAAEIIAKQNERLIR